MTWLAMLLVGAGSYVFRVVPLLVLPRLQVPARVDAALRDGGTAAVTALIVSALTHRGGGVELTPSLLAVGAALALALRGCSLLRIVAGGLGVYAVAVAVTAWVA
jgi:branched-subunit amino acid transport protein